MMLEGFDLNCWAGKTARVWLQGRGGELSSGQALALLPIKDRETEGSPPGYLAPLCKVLIEGNRRHVNLVVCEEDQRALKRGIGNLGPAVQQDEPQAPWLLADPADVRVLDGQNIMLLVFP